MQGRSVNLNAVFFTGLGKKSNRVIFRSLFWLNKVNKDFANEHGRSKKLKCQEPIDIPFFAFDLKEFLVL